MHAIVKFFDLPAQTQSGGLYTQKVAIKLPGRTGTESDTDFGRFSEIMAALTQLPTDQLQQSLGHFSWVPIDGNTKEWLPLIDLSDAGSDNGDMIQMLMSASGQAQMPPVDLQLASAQLNMTESTAEGFGPVGPIALNIGKDLHADTILKGGESNAVEIAVSEFIDDPTNTSSSEETVTTDFLGKPKLVENSNLPQALADAGKSPAGLVQEEQKQAEKSASTLEFLSLKEQLGKDLSQVDSPKKESPPDQSGQQLFQGLIKPAKQSRTSTQQDDIGKKPQQEGLKIFDSNHLKTADPNKIDAGEDVDIANQNPNLEKALSEALDKQRPVPKSSAENGQGASLEQTSANSSQPTQTAQSLPHTSQMVEADLKTIETKAPEKTHSESDQTADTKSLQTDVIRQIVQRMSMRTDGRQSQMNIKLKPEFLGDLRLEVVTENRQVMIRMAAENHAVREIIEQNIHVLKSELQQHGLQIQKFDVFVAQDNDQWKNGRRFQHAHDSDRRQARRMRDGTIGNIETTEGNNDNSPNTVRGKRSEVDFFA
jgi:flagellar hook-length control protein FliK